MSIRKRFSSFYIGELRHRRFKPKLREFSHTVGYAMIDLDEVDSLFQIPLLFSHSRPALYGFEREALFNPKTQDLKKAVLDRIESELGFRPNGPVRVLTQLKSLGVAFNPVSFYYCYAQDGETPLAVLSEITNTPWDERHTYVQKFDSSTLRSDHQFQKEFHVSPFLGMDYRYRWRFNSPGKNLVVHMENHAAQMDFDATLTLQKREWNTAFDTLYFLSRFALMPIFTLFMIYLHAAVIWMRGIPFFSHPKHQKNLESEEKK